MKMLDNSTRDLSPIYKKTTLQNMYPSYSLIWVSALVLQRSISLPASQRIEKNAEKSGFMDYRCISHFTIIGS